jgi:23S rRNA (pseudouridine1915-N3)-methyltransferase
MIGPMEFSILSIGKWKASPEKSLFESYLRRMPWQIQLVELDSRERDDAQRQKQEEAQRLRDSCKQLAVRKIIVLDERGKDWPSRELAGTLRRWQDEQAVRKVAVIIGGHAGVADELRQEADLCLSLGKLTWPHLLVRALVAEQLYRSYCVLTNHPYHRD